MAPPSTGPEPPFDRSDAHQREQLTQQEQAGASPELYGPLEIERYVKDDSRTLILYTRREHEQA